MEQRFGGHVAIVIEPGPGAHAAAPGRDQPVEARAFAGIPGWLIGAAGNAVAHHFKPCVIHFAHVAEHGEPFDQSVADREVDILGRNAEFIDHAQAFEVERGLEPVGDISRYEAREDQRRLSEAQI